MNFVPEVFTHSTTSEWCNVLQWSGLGGGGSHDDAVLHGILLLKGLDELGDGGTLLSDGNVDAVKLLGLIGSLVPSLLVQHGVESDGSLTSLTITNDQLTLTTANWHHGVDRLETSLDWLVDRLSRKNTRSLHLSTATLLGLEWSLAIDWVTEGVNDTAKKFDTDWDIDL